MADSDEDGNKVMGCVMFFALPIAIGVGCLVGEQYGVLRGIAAGLLTFPGVIIVGFLMF